MYASYPVKQIQHHHNFLHFLGFCKYEKVNMWNLWRWFYDYIFINHFSCAFYYLFYTKAEQSIEPVSYLSTHKIF